MVKVEKEEYEFSDAMKADAVKEAFEGVIKNVTQEKTKFGDKKLMELEDGKKIFLNGISMQNLVPTFGDETDNWKGQKVVMESEQTERTRNLNAIIVSPL